MKTIADLEAIRADMKNKIALRKAANNTIRVVVGMGTCGIAAGARPVLLAFNDEIQKKDLATKITVTQCGCIGLCEFEPIVEVFEEGKEEVTYINMSADKVSRVVDEHLINGKPVAEYMKK